MGLKQEIKEIITAEHLDADQKAKVAGTLAVFSAIVSIAFPILVVPAITNGAAALYEEGIALHEQADEEDAQTH